MNILVVDDSELIRSRLVGRLHAIAGLGNIVTATTLREALNCLHVGRFDLVILDLHLPDGTSSVAVQTMLRMAPELRIAIFTNDADEVNRRLCVKAGAHW
ncbi:MAG: response regulator, partial [Rhodoferax sp.]